MTTELFEGFSGVALSPLVFRKLSCTDRCQTSDRLSAVHRRHGVLRMWCSLATPTTDPSSVTVKGRIRWSRFLK